MNKLTYIFALILLLVGCKSSKVTLNNDKEIRTIDSTVITYRDSVIYVDVPKERYVNIANLYDTLHLETSMAYATAYLDSSTNLLKGEIKNKENAQLTKTVYLPSKERIVYKDSIINKEIPVEVQVVKYKRDTFYWIMLFWLVASVLWLCRKPIIKLIKKI